MNYVNHKASPLLLAIAVFAGLLPLVGISIAYVMAAAAGNVPSCFVYIEGCTSISATGRLLPESILFKGAMVGGGMLILLYLYAGRHWLQLHGDTSYATRALPWIGLFALTFLIVYTSVLGSIDDAYDTVRRIAVLSYLSSTLMAQLLITRRIEILKLAGRMEIAPWLFRAKAGLVGAMLLLGLGIIPASLFTPDSKVIERVLEWNFCLLSCCYYPVTAFAWHAHGLRVDFSLRN